MPEGDTIFRAVRALAVETVRRTGLLIDEINDAPAGEHLPARVPDEVG